MELISNDPTAAQKVLTTLESQLQDCQEFCISVAFITESGITPLLQTFKELETRNVPGKVLTSNYLSFSEPKAIEKLASLKNLEVKIFRTDLNNVGFHTKGYIFRKDDDYTFLVGSSNLTLNAITKNKEWNTKKSASREHKFSLDIMSEFDGLWESATDVSAYIDEYKVAYAGYACSRKEARIHSENIAETILTPNKMQQAFIENLRSLREGGQQRALLISATGTGKTYAAAFAIKDSLESCGLRRVYESKALCQYTL